MDEHQVSRQPEQGKEQVQPYGALVPPPQQPYGSTAPVPPSPPYDRIAEDAPVPARPRRTAAMLAIGAAALAIVVLSFVVGGEPASFMTIGLLLAPLAVLAALAYAGTENSVAAMFTYMWLALVGFAILFYSLANTLLAVIANYEALNVWLETRGTTPPAGIFKPEAGTVVVWTIILLMVAALISALMLARPVRVALARIMPIDPDSFVHKIALSILTLITLSSFAPLIVLEGNPPLLEFIKAGGLSALSEGAGQVGLEEGATTGTRPQDLIYQLVWTIPVALVAAGWPIRRSIGSALRRLAFVVPTAKQVLFGVLTGLVLFFIAALALEPGIRWVWQAMGWPVTDVAAFEDLMSNLITPVGAVIIGVTAGIGEEMAVRGLLQPRIGLIASNLVFTSLHAYQYGFDALLSVFVVGLVLGIVRNRSNTTTSAIVHAVYNFVTVMASVLASGQV